MKPGPRRAAVAAWRLCAAAALAPIAVALSVPAAATSTLSLCPGATPAHAVLAKEYHEVDGGSVILRLDAQPLQPGCASLVLPPQTSDVADIMLLPPAAAADAAAPLALQGNRDARGGFVIAQIEGGNDRAEPAAPLIAPGRNLVPLWTARPFGVEERAVVAVDDGRGAITLSCRPGGKPAGVTIAYPAALPPIGDLTLVVAAQGDAGFVIAAPDDAARRSDSAITLLTLPPSTAIERAQAALPQALERGSALSWSVLCPVQGGRLRLAHLSLEAPPRKDGAAPLRSAWAWQPAVWRDRPGALLARLSRLGIARVFISVTMANDQSVATAPALAAFIKAAAARDIAVWAVEGDPYAVLPSEREKFRTRAGALAAFNQAEPADRRLSGVQFDIEPYLVPGYALAPDQWIAAYLDTLALLGAAAQMPVEAAIPFWFPLDRWGDRLAGVAGSVALMDYRTRTDDIERLAAPVLAWGAVHRRAVHIGLEFGPLGTEERQVFRRAPRGQLWRVALGDREALVLLHAPAENPAGAAYALASRREIAENGLSFRGREAVLSELLPLLTRDFAPWPSFAGIALHGLF